MTTTNNFGIQSTSFSQTKKGNLKVMILLSEDDENKTKLFNKYFINAVQNTVTEASSYLGDSPNSECDTSTVKRIRLKHSNILKIKEFYKESQVFKLVKVNTVEINKKWRPLKRLQALIMFHQSF